MLFSPFTLSDHGSQPSDPETSPLVPARYASDTTLRLVAQKSKEAPQHTLAMAAVEASYRPPRDGLPVTALVVAGVRAPLPDRRAPVGERQCGRTGLLVN